MKHAFSAIIIFITLISSCKKDSFITSGDARIFISADTLHFDTIFTATGSVTRVFKIFNDNDQKLLLNEVSLGGGNSSFFRINVNGSQGPRINNIEIEANDSIYVFTTVLIDANANNLPFLVQDSIQISYNGNNTFVQLQAFGENAHFLKNHQITNNEIWTNDLPYVILGGLVVPENTTLTIEKGAKIYFHADAPLIVEGTLIVNGEHYDSTRVHFRGDRRTPPYNEYPGSWPGIYFRLNSKNNILDFAVIQNAYQGVVAEGPASNANPKLTLNGCIINNIFDAGILGIQTSITATNCLVSNAGGAESNNIHLTYGGTYQFNHCTVVSFGNNYVTHNNSVLYLSNYTVSNNTKFPADLNAQFQNCIFWGNGGLVDDEVVVTRDGTNSFAANFINCLWKAKNEPANIVATAIIRNLDPAFDSINVSKNYYNFRLSENSPAIDNGIATSVNKDLDGNSRPSQSASDIGAYEKP